MHIASKVFALLSASLSLGLVACSAPGSSEDAALAEEAVTTTCANVQIVPYATEGAKKAAYNAFLDENPGDWYPELQKDGDQELRGGLVEPLTGAVQFSRRTGEAGPAIALTEARVDATVRAFITKNWRLFGFRTLASAERAKVSSKIQYTNGPWRVSVVSALPQVGYEDVEGSEFWFQSDIEVGTDGVIRYFMNHTSDRPLLTMSKVPHVSAESVKHKVVGVKLTTYGSFYSGDEGAVYEHGTVVLDDIVGFETALRNTNNEVGGAIDGNAQLRLEHKIVVQRPDGFRASFRIDMCTGQLRDGWHRS